MTQPSQRGHFGGKFLGLQSRNLIHMQLKSSDVKPTFRVHCNYLSYTSGNVASLPVNSCQNLKTFHIILLHLAKYHSKSDCEISIFGGFQCSTRERHGKSCFGNHPVSNGSLQQWLPEAPSKQRFWDTLKGKGKSAKKHLLGSEKTQCKDKKQLFNNLRIAII